MSNTVTTFGWFSAPAARASCSKRRTRTESPTVPDVMTLIATSRSRRVSRARSRSRRETRFFLRPSENPPARPQWCPVAKTTSLARKKPYRPRVPFVPLRSAEQGCNLHLGAKAKVHSGGSGLVAEGNPSLRWALFPESPSLGGRSGMR
jgi:hypothetical protein